MQIPILRGIYSSKANVRVAYPENMMPILQESGLSKGYLHPFPGIDSLTTGVGLDRGAINWNDNCYRVSGLQLIKTSADGVVTTYGSVGGTTSPVSFAMSFDYLAIASNLNLYLFDGVNIVQVTDADLGNVVDVIWVDGYFMTTDGTNLVVTELNDPFSVDPLKYGSSEADPDPVIALKKVRNEVCALNRYTIETFSNVGGDNFPFQRVEGAQVQKGCVGTHACTVIAQSLAFIGSGRGEQIGVYVVSGSNALKISSREIDIILNSYTTSQLSAITIDTKIGVDQELMLIHLPDKTLVYDFAASKAAEESIWFVLKTNNGQYTARNFVWCYDKWNVGHVSTSQIGTLNENSSKQWGEKDYWGFGTPIIYNDAKGAIVNSLELIAVTGHTALGVTPTVYTQYSQDGQVWSNLRGISAGTIGQTLKRLVWFRQGRFGKIRSQRFSGDSDTFIGVSRLEADIEACQW